MFYPSTRLLLLSCLASVVVLASAGPIWGAAGAEPNTFQKPIKASGSPAALIWIQGAQVRASLYKPLLSAIQAASGLSLWTGSPSFILDTPEPARLQANIDSTLSMMYAAGMDKRTPVYFGAHSLGTVFLQSWCAKNTQRCKGLILTGGFIARSNYLPKFKFPVPTLTMGGSLDGLARVTRTVAEAYYHQVKRGAQGREFPVVVIEGMNHAQWAAGKGAVTALIKKRDLKPELSQSQATNTGAALAADFLGQLTGTGGGSRVAKAVSATGTFVAPIIAAYELEGSKNFNSPRQIGGALAKECVKGGCPDKSGWAPEAQAVIAGPLNGWKLTADNQFVSCSSTPLTGQEFHLPTISNNTAKRLVHTTTYSQCKWATGEGQDTGFVYTSASEIGTKLSSRQCLMIRGVGIPDTPFSVDDPNFCMMANQKAYQWALGQAGSKTKKRYSSHGQPYTFGADIPKSGGPLFLGAGITYKDNGDKGVEILSPMQKTSIDYWAKHFHVPRPSGIPDPGCFHYCKLLSPARAMEWIYVDSLRRHLPIA